MSGKKRAVARARVKNARRLRRNGRKPWMNGKPVLTTGNGGTDKSGTVKPAPTYRSQASAEIRRGVPHKWEGLEFHPK